MVFAYRFSSSLRNSPRVLLFKTASQLGLSATAIHFQINYISTILDSSLLQR